MEKPNNGDRMSFKAGVAEFWDWYPQVSQRFFDTIESGDCEKLTDETVQFMAKHLPHMSWVFGPGEGKGHSFTVSGEGIVPKQLLADYWCKQAKELPGWTFFSSRQPSENSPMAISVGEQDQVDSDGFLVQSDVDDENQLLHIVTWHPALAKVPEEHHFQILFLLLDDALGEFGTQTWIGEIKIEPTPQGVETRTLTELPAYIEQVNRYHEWEKLPPPETYTLYQVDEQRDGPRGDTIVGTSIIPNVVGRYIHHQGKLPEDPLEGTGALLAYVAIDSKIFPEGKQSAVRGNIEDALDEALGAQLSGRTLGGAFGIKETYIDLLLFDGDESRQIVESTLHGLQLGAKTRMETFA